MLTYHTLHIDSKLLSSLLNHLGNHPFCTVANLSHALISIAGCTYVSTISTNATLHLIKCVIAIGKNGNSNNGLLVSKSRHRPVVVTSQTDIQFTIGEVIATVGRLECQRLSLFSKTNARCSHIALLILVGIE